VTSLTTVTRFLSTSFEDDDVTTALLRSESDNDLKGWCDVCCTFVDIVAKKNRNFLGLDFFLEF
jgi:hypothetical protein